MSSSYVSSSVTTKNVNDSIIEKLNLVPAVKAFTIANAFYFLGIIALIFSGTFVPLPVTFIDLDFGFIYVIQQWAIIISNPELALALLGGWIISSIWAKRAYGAKYIKIIVIATQIPTIIYLAFILFILIILVPLIGITGLSIALRFFIQSILSVIVISLGLSIPGIVIATVFNVKEVFQYRIGYDKEFLILNTVPPTRGERESLCPFRMKDRPGCSFLGYEAPDDHKLICDFESTYKQCIVYLHITEKEMEVKE